jgi:hypothetical protein
MLELFRQFSLGAKLGLIGGTIGIVVGAVAVVAVSPVVGSIMYASVLVLTFGALWMGFAPQIRRNRLLPHGLRTQATVLDIKETGWTVQQNYGVAKLKLRVDPPGGGQPYEVTTKALVNRFDTPAYQPGARLEVVLDPAHPERVAVV